MAPISGYHVSLPCLLNKLLFVGLAIFTGHVVHSQSAHPVADFVVCPENGPNTTRGRHNVGFWTAPIDYDALPISFR